MSKGVPRRRVIMLPAGVTVEAYNVLRQRLEAFHGAPVHLRINDNTSTLLSVRHNGAEGAIFSVHRMFLSAEDAVIAALAQYLRKPTSQSQQLIRSFMNGQSDAIRSRISGSRPIQLRSRGMVYDLHKLASQVNAEQFAGEIKAYISWSRGRLSTKRRRHIVFGSYDHKSHLIRIHPALDHADVPEYFVKFVIYHEMLHAQLEPERDADGRRCLHSAEFRAKEKRYPDYKKAMEFEKKFMGKTI